MKRLTYAFATSAAAFTFACGGGGAGKGASGGDTTTPVEEADPTPVETETGAEPAGIDTSAATVEKGAGVYGDYCSFCHGEGGEGSGKSPAVIGEGALGEFSSYKEVLDYVTKEMPSDDPGALSAEEYGAVVGFLKAKNEEAGVTLE